MNGKAATQRDFLAVAFSEKTWRTILREDSRASRYVRVFLRAKAREPFTRGDLTMLHKRTVDRRLAEWRMARVLETAGRVRHKLPFDARTRKEAKARMHPDRRGYRRGRPLERYRIADPLVGRPGFERTQLHASVALLKDPRGPQIMAAPIKRWLQLMSEPQGRKFFEEWLIPLFPEELRPAWRDILQAFEQTDPALLAALPDRIEAEIVAVCRDTFPQLATVLETLAERSGKPRDASGSEPSSTIPERGGTSHTSASGCEEELNHKKT